MTKIYIILYLKTIKKIYYILIGEILLSQNSIFSVIFVTLHELHVCIFLILNQSLTNKKTLYTSYTCVFFNTKQSLTTKKTYKILSLPNFYLL